MKKAYEYLDEIEVVEFIQSDDIFHRNSVVENLIKQVQRDTIDETCIVCAKKAQITVIYDKEQFSTKSWDLMRDTDGNIFSVMPNKKSVLSVADKLKSEL